MDFKSKIRSFDLFDYMERQGVSFKAMSGGTFYYVNCWNCGKQKMFIHNNEYKGFYRCWVCGHKGDLFDLICHYEQTARPEAIRMVLGSYASISGNQDELLKLEFGKWNVETKREKNKEIALPGNMKPLWTIPDSNCYFYAETRGITVEMMKKFKIHGSDALKRVYFVIEENGKVIGWQGRAISEWMQPKLLSNAGLKKGLCLYNYDNVKSARSVVITEGPIDAIKAHRHNSVALLGKSMSNEQFLLLQSLPNLEKIYIALDPDAIDNAKDLATKLISHFDVYMVNFPGNTDMGDCDEKQVDYYMSIARPYSNQTFMSFGKMLEEDTL
jgi:DNA primase